LQGTPVDRRFADAIAKALADLKTRDPISLSESSGGQLKGNKLWIRHLNKEAVLNLESGELQWSDGLEMEGDFKVVLLHYLQKADARLDAQWISYRELEGGALYYSVFQGRAIAPLIKHFGDNPETLLGIASKLGGKVVKRGDASIDFPFFPFLLVNVTIWKGDDEVPSSANILFDGATRRILPAEDVAHLAADLVHAILAAVQ
jgi:hypothetical protein